MKRVCLFAGYNYKNKISNYVIDYLKELKNYCDDIYYLADGTLDIKELDKISNIVNKAWVIEHHGYDFYSWHLLVTEFIGWNKLYDYDEVLFVNDSNFCINSFSTVFDKMDKMEDLDVWGLSALDYDNITEFSTYEKYKACFTRTFCIVSYFLAFRKKFVKSKHFYDFISNIKILNGRDDVYLEYEVGLSRLINENQLISAVWDDTVYRYATSYMRDTYNRIKNGYPLLKVRIFVDNIGGQSYMGELAETVEPYCKYPFKKYIKEVKSERKVRKEVQATTKRIKHNQMIIYMIPPFLTKLIQKRRFLYSNNIVKLIKSFISSLVPPFLIDVIYSISFRLKGIGVLDEKRFTIRPYDRYKGVYPCHIKNYNQIHEARAAKLQDSKCMVIYFNLMRLAISGGMLSINRFVENSKKIANEKGFDLVLSNIPLNNACITNPYYEHSIEPIDFKYIAKYCKPEKLLLNIPEAYVPHFILEITKEEYLWLWSIKELHINILNQNIDYMPPQYFIEELRTICNNNLTITAAHEKYATKTNEYLYKCPVYLLTPFLPEFYYKDISMKKKQIVLSPDIIEERSNIIKLLQKYLPEYKLITVKKMKLEDYKDLISSSKYAITFGEGYDGYFIEPYLSGSVAFSVLNTRFFPKNFKEMPTIYSSWNEMEEKLIKDIKNLDMNNELYSKINREMIEEIRKYTNNKQSEIDLSELYERFLEYK